MAETTKPTVPTALAAATPRGVERKPRGSVTGPLAEVSAGWERAMGSDPRDPVPFLEPVHADEDVLVPRPDLGDQAYTYVQAGDRLPARDDLGTPAPAPSARAKVIKGR